MPDRLDQRPLSGPCAPPSTARLYKPFASHRHDLASDGDLNRLAPGDSGTQCAFGRPTSHATAGGVGRGSLRQRCPGQHASCSLRRPGGARMRKSAPELMARRSPEAGHTHTALAPPAGAQRLARPGRAARF